MKADELKKGRPRRYELDPAGPPFGSFSNREVATYASSLRELRARACDQLEDLPAEALRWCCPGTNVTIEWLGTHLVAAELGWMKRLGPADGADSLEAEVKWAGTMAYRDPPAGAPGMTGRDIVALCDRLEREVTIPVLAPIPDPEAPTTHEQLTTVRKALVHLLWHWTYHSGQIGLARLLWGSDYEWRF